MSGILNNAMESLYEETDLELAEQAIASDLKLIEGLIKTDPENDELLLMACQGFGAYSLGFVEDKSPERAQALYLRGRDYGLRILNENSEFKSALTGNVDAFENALHQFDEADVPALFWTANNWASWINLNFSNPDALADLPRVQQMMSRVLELNEGYFYGSAHLFFATIYAIRPLLLGGNMEKAADHFDRCFEFSREKFLMPYVYYAEYYLTRQFDEEGFKEMLNKVIQTPVDILPGQQLTNAIAKKKAKMLLARIEDLF